MADAWAEALDHEIRSICFDGWQSAIRGSDLAWLFGTEALYWVSRNTRRTWYQQAWGVGDPTRLVGGIDGTEEALNEA